MNINLNNYEEFFLMYADNELATSERAEVEAFVAANPDLRVELQMFCDTVFIPEPSITLIDKTALYRTEGGFINAENCESIFVLYHDNELTVDEQYKTEEFLSQFPDKRQLFTDLGRSRLIAEPIVFGNKASLYRKEGKVRVMPILWRVAAAVILLISAYGGWNYLNKEQQVDIAKGSSTDKKTLPSPVNNGKEQTKQELAVENNPAEDNNPGPVESKDPQPANNSTSPVNVMVAVKEKTIPSQKNEKEISLKNENLVADNSLNKVSEVPPSTIKEVTPSTDYALTSSKNLELQDGNKSDTEVQGAIQTAYLEEEQSNKDNYVFYNVSEEKFKKSKVGVFLRKAKRVVSRNTFLGGNKGKIASIDATQQK